MNKPRSISPGCHPDYKSEGIEKVDGNFELGGMDYARIRLTSPYPAAGMVSNTQCECVVIIASGRTKLEIDGETLEYEEGTALSLPPNCPYRWVPDGEVTLHFISSPPFNLDQQRLHEQ